MVDPPFTLRGSFSSYASLRMIMISLASLLFFFSIGYASNYFSKYLNDQKMWKIINWIIITIMTVISLYVLKEVINSI